MLKRKKFPELSDEELKDYLCELHFKRDLSVNSMAKLLDLSRDTIYRWFTYFDIKARNQSESAYARMRNMTSEERKALASKAHEAVRGSKMPLRSKLMRAQTMSIKAKMSKHEKTFAKHLIDNDIYDFIFSYPIDIYNIDFAFPVHKIAVEVDGGNWHTTKDKRRQDQDKEDYLTSEGWVILRWSNLTSRLPDVIAQLKTHLSAHS